MSRLLTVSRAARLVGVSRGTLQKKIQDGELPSFEGQLDLDDLTEAYPEAQVEDNSMLEKIEHIIDNALNRARGDRLRKLLTPDLGTLAARVAQLSKELASARHAAEHMQALLGEMQQRLQTLANSPSSTKESSELATWLDTALVQPLAPASPAQLLTRDTLLRVIAAQVHIMPSGHDFFVEGNTSILEAGLNAGEALNYGCSNGNCGKCKMRLISGEVRKLREHEYVISEAEQRQGYLLACSNTAVTDVVLAAEEARVVEDIPPQKIPAYIKHIDHLSDRLAILQLKSPRSQRLRFLSGQKIRLSHDALQSDWLHIASCPCDAENLQLHITRDASPFSDYLFNRARPRDALDVEGPQGEFVLRRELQLPSLFIAVDTGFAPVKSLIEHSLTLDAAENIHLYWLTTGNNPHYQHNLCRAWTDAFDQFRYTPVELGEVTDASRLMESLQHIHSEYPDLSGHLLYIAAPAELLETARQFFIHRGVQDSHFFGESL